MARRARTVIFAAMFGLMIPAIAMAQAAVWEQTQLDAHVGQAWFLDEAAIRHDVVGIGVARTASSRFWLKASLMHMRGPGRDRDWMLMGHVSFDVVKDGHPAVPFVSLGVGLSRHTNSAYGRDIEHYGPIVALTTGVRLRLGDRWFVTPEAAMGFGPHTRLGITFGVRK